MNMYFVLIVVWCAVIKMNEDVGFQDATRSNIEHAADVELAGPLGREGHMCSMCGVIHYDHHWARVKEVNS